ncbi:transketolase [Telmatobacter sp. DSM 110680]|uniref:Transketolase n=1 Tax=Telmatobacter sp. DSM 110680 TaxID=3036704 RepID=A0AAU7DHY7_9BACT
MTHELLIRAKQRLLQMHYESGVGHIGGNLSCLDMLMTLYHEVLDDNDEFVLSKGHAAGAMYVTLWSLGVLTDDDLRSFHKDGTRLSGHPPLQGIPEIPFATGSLGHGLSLSCGLALGRKLKQEPGRVFCLMSDGEWNEGSNWEALIFLKHHHLDNLTLIVDLNGLQGMGPTRDIADLSPLANKFRAFGLSTVEVNGHDCESLVTVLQQRESEPIAVVANTTKGMGVSFMENRFEWHYLPIREEQYRQAILELSKECAKNSVEPS